jgi:hypothetical protein
MQLSVVAKPWFLLRSRQPADELFVTGGGVVHLLSYSWSIDCY